MRAKRKQKRYSHEFKLEAVRLVESSDRPMKQLAEELGVPVSTLEDWVRQFGTPASVVEAPVPDGPLTPADRDELKQLRKENERLRMERDFLKKAAAFFASENK